MRVIVTDNYKIPDYRNQLHRFLKDGYTFILTSKIAGFSKERGFTH
jgi:hypothetical protein